ncbi:TIGR02444 family protein [Parashewanella spongiae]|uniref:TIGR02444 family protein n=1 Tax=Parashewanella spongiae TaxID=342950 RepID=A0A3A6TBV3_9GAMM|nr:TIGR02444 family protein [Parashewanella spongiae]MCL1078379.1 TIGR02444 family protein [Parashewanella spongiae]RJY07087.1 TIGR02444 family protein [Parashewanella spongiae]
MHSSSNDQHTEYTAIWQQCEHTYSRNQTVCLPLQDEFGINVNLLLLAHHLDNHCHEKYSTEQWQSFIKAIEQWETKILLPFRRLRKLAKPMINENEYQQMLDLELLMERKSQRLISYKLQLCYPDSLSSNLNNYLSIYNLTEHDVIFN